jgi:thymidylate kinase
MASRRPPSLLVAAEGLDGSGKSQQLDLLARWLERRGRRVTVEPWAPSDLVDRAVAQPRLRAALTPRVAALLTAADAARRLDVEVRRPLEAGRIVLADRYAWTAVAREIARGLEPEWVASLYGFAPRPDLVLFFRQGPDDAVARSLARRDSTVRAAAISFAFEAFLERMLVALDRLAAGADGFPAFGPWPVRTAVLDAHLEPARLAVQVREAVRPLLERTGVAAP